MSSANTTVFERARRFVESDLWIREWRPGSIAARGIRVLQLVVVIAEGFVQHHLLLRTGALTYISLLSMIPLIAMVLAVLKALGVSANLAQYFVTQIPTEADSQAQLLELINKVDIGQLGAVGGAVFVITTVLVLRHLESTLNDLWGVQQTRGWARRFADYLAVLIVGPLLLSAALSLGTTLQADPVLEWFSKFPGVTHVYSMGLQWVPTVLAAVAFTFLYWFFPNTRVRVFSAALGGVISAILFSAAQYSYVAFSVGAAKYNALFGAFAALPLLFVWIYVFWAIVLMGAEICFAHQTLGQYRREVRDQAPGAAERESLSFRIVAHVARAFRDRAPPPTADELADCVDISVRTVNGILQQLESSGVLSETVSGARGRAYQLGRPADDIQLSDVLDAIRGGRRRVVMGRDDVCDLVEGILGELRGLESPLAENRTVADILRTLGPRRDAPDEA